MKLYGLKLLIIVGVFTLHAPGTLDIKATNIRYYGPPRFRIKKRTNTVTKINMETNKFVTITQSKKSEELEIQSNGKNQKTKLQQPNAKKPSFAQTSTITAAAITIGYSLSAEEEINQILETCLFKVSETKTKPFSYFVKKMIATIKKYWHAFRTKFSSENELKQLLRELDSIKNNKNIISVGKVLSKYKKLLPSHSIIHKTSIFTLKGLLSARLAIVGDDKFD